MPADDALRVVAALPEGFRAAPTVAAWVGVVQAHPDVAGLRPRGRASLLAVCWALAGYADRRTAVTRPGWELLRASCRLSRSTMAAWLAWLRHHRLIGHVESGSTPRFRHGDDDGAGNRAAVYVLLTPTRPKPATAGGEDHATAAVGGSARATTANTDAPDNHDDTGERGVVGTRTPSHSFGVVKPYSHARETGPEEAALRAAGNNTQQPAKRPAWPADRPAYSRRDRLAAADTLAFYSPPCRRISPRHLRHITGNYMKAGWTVQEIMHAIDYLPDGTAHPYAYQPAELHRPAGWLTWRLAHWQAADGTIQPGHHQHTGRQHHDTPDNRPAVNSRPADNAPDTGHTGHDSDNDGDEVVDPVRLAADKAALRAKLTAATEKHTRTQHARHHRPERQTAAPHRTHTADHTNTGTAAADTDHPAPAGNRAAAAAAARARTLTLARARAKLERAHPDWTGTHIAERLDQIAAALTTGTITPAATQPSRGRTDR